MRPFESEPSAAEVDGSKQTTAREAPLAVVKFVVTVEVHEITPESTIISSYKEAKLEYSAEDDGIILIT